jgi:aminoglycoside phosphotransferase family enzyme
MTDQAARPVPAQDSARACTLADKVAWLQGRLGPGDEAIETHFAHVFLVGERAWKLRKPVRRDPMDYGTLDARRRDSTAEVRLNRRLAPDTYLGVRPLNRDDAGAFSIDGAGEVVDWLVEMRRLDRSRMLDAVLQRGAVTPDDLEAVATVLATFYRREAPAIHDGATYQARLRSQVEANHLALVHLDRMRALRLRDAQLSFLAARRPWLDLRAAAGCIVEAHGDLRPEHVLLGDPPIVIDCLEFDRNLRILDRAEELAFLALECARIGHADAGLELARRCCARLGDEVPDALRCFYLGHRAATRAKLYTWRAEEPDGDGDTSWRVTARAYLDLALDAVPALRL